jgi:NADH dehydrogenase
LLRYDTLVCATGSTADVDGWLSPRARCHVYEAFDRLGIDVLLETVVEVRVGGVALADRRIVAADAVLWTAGLHTPPLAGEAGLRVDTRGRVLVDATLRSLSHPDVYAVGDAAAVFGPGPAALSMGCTRRSRPGGTPLT